MGQTKTKILEGKSTQATQAEESTSRNKKVRARGKAYKQARTLIDKNKIYTISAALDLLKEASFTKFDQTVELHIKTRKENINVSVKLPNSTGKTKTIEIADEKTISKLKEGKVDFDVLLATADMMPKLVPFARILGPKGMMPNPKNGTLIKTAKDADKFSTDKMELKTEKKAPLIHTVVGKLSLDKEKLAENANAILDAIGRKQILSAHLTATMTPSARIEVN